MPKNYKFILVVTSLFLFLSTCSFADTYDTTKVKEKTEEVYNLIDQKLVEFSFPTTSSAIPTQRVGYFKYSVEGLEYYSENVCLKVNSQSPVYAILSGTISEVGFNKRLGNFIKMTHTNNIVTTYCFLKEPKVLKGDIVEAGTQIGLSGSTGRCSGPILGIFLQKDNTFIDAYNFLK